MFGFNLWRQLGVHGDEGETYTSKGELTFYLFHYSIRAVNQKDIWKKNVCFNSWFFVVLRFVLFHDNSLIPMLPNSQSGKKEHQTGTPKHALQYKSFPADNDSDVTTVWILSRLSWMERRERIQSFLVSSQQASCLLGHGKKIFPFQKQPLYLDLEAIDLPGLHFWGSYKTSAGVEQPDLDGNSSDGKHIGAIQYSALWLLCDGSCIPLYGSLFETVKRWLIQNGLV